ncbi:MAG: FKBP-type peptidyl-prolyl cis-trans isomerase [bacterium]
MKIRAFVLFLIVIVIAACSSKDKKLEKSDLETEKQKVSYAIGMDIGKGFKQQNIDVDFDYLYQGIIDGTDSVQLMTTVEAQNVIQEWQQNRQKEMEKAKVEIAQKNLVEAKKFTEENSHKQGVVSTASGLQYKILQSANGPSPKPQDTVLVHFKGFLLDGTVINDTYKNGSPVKIPVNGFLPAWAEALPQMKLNEKWQLFIPPALGFGEKGRGSLVPPNAMLIFEVELLDIIK